MKDDMVDLFAPHQSRFGMKNGAESSIHAARVYLNNHMTD